MFIIRYRSNYITFPPDFTCFLKDGKSFRFDGCNMFVKWDSEQVIGRNRFAFEQTLYCIAFDGWAIYNGVYVIRGGFIFGKYFREGSPILKFVVKEILPKNIYSMFI